MATTAQKELAFQIQRTASENGPDTPGLITGTVVGVGDGTVDVQLPDGQVLVGVRNQSIYPPETTHDVLIALNYTEPVVIGPTGIFYSAPPNAVVPPVLTSGLESMEMQWDPSTDFDVAGGKGQYEAEISLSNTTTGVDGHFADIIASKTTSGTSAVFTGLTGNTVYYTHYRAIDHTGNVGPWSTIVSGLTGFIDVSDLDPVGLRAAIIPPGSINTVDLANAGVTGQKIAALTITAGNITIGALADNGVANPGFEDLLPGSSTLVDAWTYNYDTTDAGAVWGLTVVGQATGARAVTVSATPTTSGTVASRAVAVAPFEVWYLAAMMKASSAITGGFYLRVYFGNAANGPNFTASQAIVAVDVLNNDSVSTTFDVSGQPYTKQGQVTVPSGAAWMRIGLRLFNPNISTTLTYDDVTVRKAIVGAQITPGGIITTNIASQAITATQLAAGAVTANKISAIIGGGNLALNSAFLASTPFYNWNVLSAAAPNSANLSAITDLAGFSMAADLADGSTTLSPELQQNATFPVFAGETYNLSAYAKQMVAGTDRGFTLRILWDDGTSVSQNFPTLPLNVWLRKIVPITVPTGKLWGRISIQAGDGSGTNTGTIRITGIKLERGDVTTAWSPATSELLPGTITGNVVAARTLSGTNLIAGTISSIEIASNAITTDELAAKSITAEKITIGTLSANYCYNSGFEDALTSDPTRAVAWTYDYEVGSPGTYDLDVVNNYTGTKALSITCTPSQASSVASTSIPVAAGDVWYLSVKAKASTATTQGFYVRAFFGTAANGPDFTRFQGFANYSYFENEGLTTSYVRKDFQVTVPSGYTWMRLVLYNYLPNVAVSYFFDDCSINKAIINAAMTPNSITALNIAAGSVLANRVDIIQGNPPSQQGIALNAQGLSLYNTSGVRTSFWDATTGNMTLGGYLTMASGGVFRTAASGSRLEVGGLNDYIEWFDASNNSIGKTLTTTYGVGIISRTNNLGYNASIGIYGQDSADSLVIVNARAIQLQSATTIDIGNSSIAGLAGSPGTGARIMGRDGTGNRFSFKWDGAHLYIYVDETPFQVYP